METPEKKYSPTSRKNNDMLIVPKHLEVINFLVKNRTIDLSWASDLEIPPKPTPYSSRKSSLQNKINKRKAKHEYIIPQDFDKLGKLLKNLKETERIIRQDNQFFLKIRDRKPEIQLTRAENRPQTQKNTKIHTGFYMRPMKIPRNSIVMR